ncbi:MAG: RsmB/NOP family class I SAM-dependent RNA methyltransferase [Betaproteobacteria bacterium]|nr:RsmB/NOP family class I SAM-dependent RNA methyltransferase [Betaproteobacteria bacterium]
MSARWTPGLLLATTAALQEVLDFAQPADAVLGNFFRIRRQLGHRDRGLIADMVYAVLRHRRWLESLSGVVTPRRMLLAALVKLEGQPLGVLEHFAKQDELPWLAQVKAAQREGLPPAVRLDLPDWIYDRLLAQFTATEVESLGRALQRPAPLDLRVNTFKTTREQAMEKLHADGIECEPARYSPAGIRLTQKPAINRHPLFESGAIEVQDEGSQLLAFLVAPRRQDMVVDFCAGAGGKTLALGAMMHSQGRLYAFDVSDKRLGNLRPRLKRSGLSNVFPQRIAGSNDSHVKRLAGKVDRVLVDAPCSGLGTVRRNPDLKWRQTQADIGEMTTKQSEILSSAAKLLKPGGRLVYATCSLLQEENQAVVETFLAAHPAFRAVNACGALKPLGIDLDTGDYLRLRPDMHETDGFFAAVMEHAKA